MYIVYIVYHVLYHIVDWRTNIQSSEPPNTATC